MSKKSITLKALKRERLVGNSIVGDELLEFCDVLSVCMYALSRLVS